MSRKVLRTFQISLLDLIFGLSAILLCGFLLFAFLQKVKNVPDLAEILPENTQAFASASLIQMRELLQDAQPIEERVFGLRIQDWPAFSGKLGLASVDGEEVIFLKSFSRGPARKYLKSLLIEDERFVWDKGVACFQVSHSDCYAFVNNWFVTSSSVEALQAILAVQSGAASLKSSPNYQNVRSRLPQLSAAFAYVDLQASRKEVVDFFKNYGLEETGFWEATFRLFPAFGITLKSDLEEDWELESFLAVDKTLLNNEAFYRSGSKYQGDLLTWSTDDFMFQWGSQDLAAQLERAREVMNRLNPLAGDVLSAALNSKLHDILGTNDFSAFRGETFIAFNPGEKPLILTKVDKEVQILSTPDDIQTGQNTRSLSPFEEVINGSDEVLRVRMNFLLKSPIVLTSGRKVFDDGITTRSLLHFE